jgi:cyclophilin family peptidyl-prolyl cis-trans isomerase
MRLTACSLLVTLSAVGMAFLPVSAAANALPAIDEPVQANRVAPTFPVGKALMFPITASDADGDVLSYKVTSSNPKIMVRAKTGNPAWRLGVSYNGQQLPEMVFQLFRDWTPLTAGFMGGFAQSGFFENLKFHRVLSGFVLQGGDPLGTGQGGPGMSGTNVDTAFRFENEFDPALIFTGRGQLAMANSGINRSGRLNTANQVVPADFTASNGSQFFITLGKPRHLDFKHTIFGQMLRGFETADQIAAVPVDTNGKPNSDVVITSSKLERNTQDAVLVLSANGVGTSEITVTVTDGNGGTVSRQFTVNAVADTVNSPPFLKAVPPQVALREKQLDIPMTAIDLEFDYLQLQRDVSNPGRNYLLKGSIANGFAGTFGTTVAVLGKPGYEGPLYLGADVAQFDMLDGSFEPVGDSIPILIGVGEKAVRGEPVPVLGTPAQELPNVIVARLNDTDPAGIPGNFTAQINWGDGTPVTTGIVSRDASRPAAALSVVSGTHTYARAGIYTIVVTATGNKGAGVVIRSQAVISAGPLKAVGQELAVNNATVGNRVLATFTDANSIGRPLNYRATIDWGDGTNSRGVIAKGPNGSFVVRGSHVYRDPEAYAISVHIQKVGSDPAAAVEAWSTATLRGFSPAVHLPPFPQAHLIGAWNSGPNKTLTHSVGAGGFVPADLQAQLAGVFIVVNSGNKTSKPGKLRFWLSNDQVLNTGGLGGDIRLTVNGTPEMLIAGLAPGGGGQVGLTLKLPKGESGGGKFLLSELVYSDPIIDFSAVPKFNVMAIDPTIIVFEQSGSQTSEAGATQTFKVVLDTAPTANVVIPLESTVAGEGVVSKVEVAGESSDPPLAVNQLVFTPANWFKPHVVTVRGVDDTIKDGTKPYQIRLKPAVSTDLHYGGTNGTDTVNGLDASDVSFTNLDNEP